MMFFESFWQDLRFGLRSLVRTPAFTLTAVCSLALAIGANTSIFSFVNAILLTHLPVPEPTRLVTLSEWSGSRQVRSGYSYPFVRELDRRNDVFDGLTGSFPVSVNLTSSGVAEPIKGEVVTGSYFKTLRVNAILGRLLSDNDVRAAAGSPVCVISHSMWQQRFGSDPGILNRTIFLNSRSYRVIGVTEPGFHGSDLQMRIEMQLPVSRMADFMGGFADMGVTWDSPHFNWLYTLARLRPGIDRTRAESMLQPLIPRIEAQLDKTQTTRRADQPKFRLLDGSQGQNFPRAVYGSPLVVLMGIVGLVLLIACTNLANLLTAKASNRQQEFAIRLSLGAGHTRLVRQLMLESFIIAAAGGLFGYVLSFWLNDGLLLYLNIARSRADSLQVQPDSLVFCYCAGLSLLTAVLFGLAPAWQSARTTILSGLKGLSSAAGGHQPTTLRKILTVCQIALAVVMLFAAGLLTRTLAHLKTVDLGFKPSHVIALSVDPTMAGYSTARRDAVFDDILARLQSQPGIRLASLATISPLEGSSIELVVDVPGHLHKPSDMQPGFDMISPRYFATLNQSLLLGRDFSDRDSRNSPRVAIVNQSFVSQYYGQGIGPIGRRFKQGGGDVEIVGVVANAHYSSVREKPRPLVYMPAKQSQSSGYTVLVQTALSDQAAIASIKQVIHSLDAKLPIFNLHTLQAQIDSGISSERILGFLSTLFSSLALLLCAIGLYGLLAYTVSRRTREIGIRMALGAPRSNVVSLFLRESALLIAAGATIGIPAALASARLLKNLLFGLDPGDPSTLAFAIGVILTTGLLATVLPVRKASRVEPLEALRYE